MYNPLKSIDKKYLYPVIGVCLLAISFWAGTKSVDPEIKVETEVVEKVVEKVVEVEVNKESEKKNTNTRIIEKPDGTKITEIVESFEKETKSANKKDSDTKKDTKSEQTIEKTASNLSKYRIGGKVGANVSEIFSRPGLLYEVNAGMRAIGPFWVDVSYNTNGSVMAGISVEF